MIPLTANERKKLLPARALANGRAPTARSVNKLLKAFAGPGADRLRTYRKGCKVDVQPELRELREAATKIVAGPTLERLAGASLEALAVAECMCRRSSKVRSLAEGVALARSPADAVEVMCRSLNYGLHAEPNWTVAVFVVSPPPPRTHQRPDHWLALRHVVCSAPDDAYKDARALRT